MLNVSDIYTSVGPNKLYGCWTQNVTKFDTSSFYNWEQDNLPIYDLDERTNFLWERLGNPTSSLYGFALVVSANATSACNTNIFTSLSACLNALPEVINAPYLIEVGSFGNLGPLSISNRTFGPNGSIEIINRNFAKSYGKDNTYEYYKERPTSNNSIASSILFTNSTLNTSINLGNEVPSIPCDLKLSKIYSTNTRIVSSTTYDDRLTGNITLFTRKTHPGFNQRLAAALADRNSTAPFSTFSQASAQVSFTPYENNLGSYEATGYDVTSFNETTQADLTWANTSQGDGAYTIPLVYGNRLTQIKIYNCNGPIFIRNFTVDGGGLNAPEYGIDIRKSVVTLENCSVARCQKAGLYGDNSRINLTRGFVAYRNYGFTSSQNRIGRPWSNKLFQKLERNNQYSYGVGIDLINSELNFSSTYERDYFYHNLGGSSTYTTTYSLSAPIPASWLFCLSRNDIGIRAINSRIFGGRNELNPPTGVASLQGGWNHAHNIIFELNTEAGIVLQNSTFDHSGRINLYSNYVGLDGVNSNISVDTMNCRFNQKEAINLTNSRLNYNKDCYSPYLTGYSDSANNLHQMGFISNGTHLKLVNSVFEPTYTSSMVTNYERFVASGSFGMMTGYNPTGAAVTENSVPAIIADSNSKLKIVSLGIETNLANLDSDQPGHYGAAISILNNSELTLQGTKTYCTKVIGPDINLIQFNKAGLFAGQNSTIKIQGPTFIAKYGVDILVDKNSNLEITPHKFRDGTFDTSGFDLTDPKNNTIVELHSTRACLVADNNSTINLKDLGSFFSNWSRGTEGSLIINSSGTDVYQFLDNGRFITSGGSLQFYPNPNYYPAYDSGGGPLISDSPANISLYSYNDVQSTNVANYIHPLGSNMANNANAHQFSGITEGGVCVRAHRGSIVNVDNVHFPCGFWNPSAIIYEYDAPAGNCCKSMIWVIADNSQLHAKYISLSGNYPGDLSSYFGPSGVWGNLSGAPSGTPDTGSLSILDYFGPTNLHRLGSPNQQNKGPFRLYFSIDPVMNYASAVGIDNFAGYLPQVYAQGYQFSGNITFPGIPSSIHKSVFNSSGTASGFFYASSVIIDPRSQRVLLDESAANTFANAKHNAVGKSGLAKVVNIYNTYIGAFGSDSGAGGFAGPFPSKARGVGIGSTNTFDLEKSN